MRQYLMLGKNTSSPNDIMSLA